MAETRQAHVTPYGRQSDADAKIKVLEAENQRLKMNLNHEVEAVR